MLKNKRGATTWLWVIVGIVVILTVASFYLGDISSAFSQINLKNAQKVSATIQSTGNVVIDSIVKGLDYVIGEVPSNLVESSGPVNAVIVLVALWVIIILMFGDILSNFGGFSREISWVIAILLGIVGANLKMMTAIAAILTAIFLPLGIFAAYAGLFAAFVAFFAVEWGIQSMMPWVMRRKGAQEAVRAQHNTGTILNAIQHYKQVGTELSTD